MTGTKVAIVAIAAFSSIDIRLGLVAIFVSALWWGTTLIPRLLQEKKK